MDHPLKLATELVGLTYPVEVNGAPKTLTFNANSILQNVQIYAMCYYNDSDTYPFQWGFLRSDQTSFPVTFQKSGYVRLFGMLLPTVHAAQINNEIWFNVVDLGVGDGTGNDFDGVMGARITISFPGVTDSNVTPYRGTPTSLPMVTDYLHTQGYLIDIKDTVFGGSGDPRYHSIQIQVDGDDHNVKMLEQMVWIHLFDGNGNLLGVIDTLDGTIINNTCNINITNGFQMMAFIQGQKNPNSQNQFSFAIGDPKNDATVTISEA